MANRKLCGPWRFTKPQLKGWLSLIHTVCCEDEDQTQDMMASPSENYYMAAAARWMSFQQRCLRSQYLQRGLQKKERSLEKHRRKATQTDC